MEKQPHIPPLVVDRANASSTGGGVKNKACYFDAKRGYMTKWCHRQGVNDNMGTPPQVKLRSNQGSDQKSAVRPGVGH